MNPNHESRPAISADRFGATRWSLVAAAGVLDAGAARRALIELCLRYWYPVYAYVRGCGHGAEIARDLTRGFFGHLLGQRLLMAEVRARGRFRQYLLEALNRFLAAERLQAPAGPVAEFEQPLPWEELEARYRSEAGTGLTPEQVYQRGYALEVLTIALARLRREAEQAGRLGMFEAMQGWLGDEPLPGQIEEVAAKLGLRPLAIVVAMKRLRQRYRELAEAELSETVSCAEDLLAEREALARALGQA
jgi:RNA polymerase sigma-70 factor (ECF subfamily)